MSYNSSPGAKTLAYQYLTPSRDRDSSAWGKPKVGDLRTHSNLRKVVAAELPARSSVVASLKEMLSHQNVPIRKVTELFLEDPILTLALLKECNQVVDGQVQPKISDPYAAVTALGLQKVKNIVYDVSDRKKFGTVEVQASFEAWRLFNLQVSKVAKIIASIAEPGFAQVAEVAGLFSELGLMLATATYGETFLKVTKGRNRHSIYYKLSNDLLFDPTKIKVDFLRVHCLPEQIIHPLDEAAFSKTPAQAALKIILQAAVEIVDAKLQGKLDKYEHLSDLPSKSSLRLLKIVDNQYKRIYDELIKYYGGGVVEGVARASADA